MELDPFRERRKHAISGIVAAVIMFAMLFSVGTGFFLFVNTNNQLYDSALGARNSAQQGRLSESLAITSLQLTDGDIGVYANDTGGIGANITALYIQYTGERVTTCMGVGLPNGCSTPSSSTFPSCQFPAYVNVGTGTKGIPTKLVAGGCTTSPGTSSGCTSSGGSLSSCLDTGEPANATVAVIRIITQRGNLFSATYPPSATTLAAQALSSGAIGDLYLSFRSYTYYTLTTTSCPVAGTPEGTGTSSGYCLASGGSAFAILHTLTGSCSNTGLSFCFAFSVRVTDLNPQHANIVLDPYTLFEQIPESGSGALSYTGWFVISNSTNVILSSYAPVVLNYNKPVSIVFASGLALTTGTTFTNKALQGPGGMAPGTITPVFIVSHGCEAIGQTTCLVANSNYGQNSPYVATLFY